MSVELSLRILAVGSDDVQVVPLGPIIDAVEKLAYCMDHLADASPDLLRSHVSHLRAELEKPDLTATRVKSEAPESIAVPAMKLLKFNLDRAIEDLAAGQPVREEVARSVRWGIKQLRQAWEMLN